MFVNKKWLVVSGFVISLIFSTAALALDSETRALKRQLMKLNNDIKMNAANMSLLLQYGQLSAQLAKSDDSTVLAALERVKSEKGGGSRGEVTLTDGDISAARKKIKNYDDLCIQVKEHASIYADYCKFKPSAELHSMYMEKLGASK